MKNSNPNKASLFTAYLLLAAQASASLSLSLSELSYDNFSLCHNYMKSK